ncbi:hypothetical protein B0187_02130 [Haemophilus paracuniculus]|uniref:Phosphate starvation-inducible protein PsiF n=1 Tax=Haemophilus paracuniculus TaxID=734 RepID=A0A1T0AUX7_9PAST|nr:hypothetical protein [Haemophilus paracuniculus]OOS00308.1 hypothetical protein B0187_02130 [Haemophilus paracuniculus]
MKTLIPFVTLLTLFTSTTFASEAKQPLKPSKKTANYCIEAMGQDASATKAGRACEKLYVECKAKQSKQCKEFIKQLDKLQAEISSEYDN